jgi:hypothetical protein
MFGQDRNQLRQMYLDAWRKQQDGAPLQPLEAMIAAVVAQHPEYHALLETGESALARDFLPELDQSNPFLHMGMHLAIREQLGTDRPPGIVALHHRLLAQRQDPHAVEHNMMECLGRVLWEAQRAAGAPDDQQYLQCLQALLRG